VVVWGVALGVGESLPLGLQPITCLEWSPDGAYLRSQVDYWFHWNAICMLLQLSKHGTSTCR
jgi:hypothetical protein